MKEIKQLLTITKSLEKTYESTGRTFSLDGKLVGDIGEVLASEKYGLKLLPSNENTHDAIQESTGKYIQIKSSFKNNFYFPKNKPIPEYFLCVNINEAGELEEIYNGTGKKVKEEYIDKKNLKGDNSGYILSPNILKELNKSVIARDRI